jgi:membrane associated rhomboid family serine protease
MHPAPVGHQCPECVKDAKQEFRRPGRQVQAGPGGARGWTLTNVMLVALGLAYVAEVVVAGPGSLVSGPDGMALIDMGGSVGLLIATGEYWRMITATFLHIGIFHLAMNGYALYLFGNVIEAEQGKIRFAAIYAVSALAASAASYAFGPPTVVSAGASGAIFGLFGAFLGAAWVKRDMAFYAARVRNAAWLIMLNVFITFAYPGIDWRAHMGGAVAGLALGVTAGTRRTRGAAFTVTCIALLAISVGLTIWRTAELRAAFPI